MTINATPTAISIFTAANREAMERHEHIHDFRETEMMKSQATGRAAQDAREAVQSSKTSKAELVQAYGHLPLVDDTKDGGYEVPEAGSLTLPNPAHLKKSELNRLDAEIADRTRTVDRRTQAHEKQSKRTAIFTRASEAVDDSLSKIIASNPRASLPTYVSPHEFDEPAPDDIKRYFAGVTAEAKALEDLSRTRAPVTDEEIEALIGPATPPLNLVSLTYAQRATALMGSKPYLRWKGTPAANAVSLAPGVPAEVAGDAVALAIWLNRDRIVEEIKRQAIVLARENGALTPKEYRAKVAEAKAAKYLAELETAAAWWRCREAGFDVVPPPVSGRALLLLAPE